MNINREDMLELTRRMTPKRNCFTRIAGCYINKDGGNDGSFNLNFRSLNVKDKEDNMKIAKAIPFSNTNVNLKGYTFSNKARGKSSMWQLLMALKSCGLKNDALMDDFYDFMAMNYKAGYDYAVIMFHAIYDVPVKASDKERLDDSEEVFDFLICAICPLIGEYEPGAPECGFLFPAFTDRSSDIKHVLVFNADEKAPHMELTEKILCCE